MNADVISGLVIVGAIAFGAWCIRNALRSGRWRLRGATIYREKSPTLFRSITALACGVSIFLSFMVVVMVNHDIVCGGRGTPRDCMAKSFGVLVERVR